MRYAPVIFQEYIHGVDLRVTVVGEHVLAAEIDATSTSYPADMRMVVGDAPVRPVNLPVGLIAIAAIYFEFPYLTPARRERRIDWAGFATLIGCVVPLLLALTWATEYGLRSARVDSLLATAAVVAALTVLTFVPFKFVHPFRVVRLRGMNIVAVLAWAGLATAAVLSDLDPGPWVTGGLVVVAVYVVTVGLTDGLKTDDRAAA